jgi:formate hydrogenlyase subunit 6/NADH:ubiquinone oxidoreductase subunit I
MLNNNDLIAWLENLSSHRDLIAPSRVAGIVVYQPVQDNLKQEIAWDYTLPALSLKEAFFPPTERLFTIHKDADEFQLHETLPEQERVIFGVRPCDARGIQALDALFIEGEPVDPYYLQRRQKTILIGLACQHKGPTCFCDRVGSAPDDPRGVDIMLRQTGNGYEIQAITEKGQILLKQHAITEDELNINDSQYTIEGVQSIDWPARFKDEYWMEMSERCLSCRICAYVCPTCRCFDVRDEPLSAGDGGGDYERLRCWDSCARETYRAIAGGHNPRAAKGERLRNRFMCKFHYYAQQYKMQSPLACTGCGRCVEACPVNIDISEVLDNLLEVS